MIEEFNRDQIIFTITLSTNYSEGYLKALSDFDLMKLYYRIMEK